MPQNYKLFTFFVAVAGTSSLVITGSLHPIFYIFIPIMLYGYRRLLTGKREASRRTIGIASITGLVIFLVDVNFITDDYLIGVGHLSLIFHAIKSFDIKEPYDPLQVFFMSLLQLVITSEFTTKILFGIILLAFIIAMLFAMVTAHFIKSGKKDLVLKELLKPVAFILFITMILSSIIFILMPRPRYGLWGKSHYKGIKNAGFTEDVSLSSGELKLDPTIVMRIEMSPVVGGPYYWRGAAFDYFDGKTWSNTFVNMRRDLPKRGDEFSVMPAKESDSLQDIMLEPVDSDIVFGLDRIVMIKGDFYRIEMDGLNNLYIPRKSSRRIHYIVRSNYNPDTTFQINKERFLQIPVKLKERIKDLTDEIIKKDGINEIDNAKKAQMIERFLRENYRYSLKIDTGGDINPVIDFLFYSKKGYCEHFATSMALMLRSQGIPSRLITGFHGGQINSIGNYIIVRQMDAHSWVEAFIDGKWIRYDPTPSVIEKERSASVIFLYMDFLKMKWQRYVVGFTDEDRIRLFRLLRPTIPEIRLRINAKNLIIFLFFIVILILIYAFYRSYLHHVKVCREIFLYIRLRKLLEKKGSKIYPSSTPSDVLSEGVRIGLQEEYLSEFISMYERWRFGGKEIDMKRYKELFKYISDSQIACKGKSHDKSCQST